MNTKKFRYHLKESEKEVIITGTLSEELKENSDYISEDSIIINNAADICSTPINIIKANIRMAFYLYTQQKLYPNRREPVMMADESMRVKVEFSR